MECLSYCISNNVDLTALGSYYRNNTNDRVSVKSRDVLKLAPQDKSHKRIFVFRNGTVVFWGIKRYQIPEYLDVVKRFIDKPIPFVVHDEFSYSVSDKTTIEPHDFFEVDRLLINSDLDFDDLSLSLSYGFSQSIKLQYFETMLESLIEKYTPWIHSMSNTGSIPFSHRRLKRVIGEILVAKSETNLISNFLYHPKYFWQHPTLEEHYIMLERYLHIQRRVNAINHRLDTLSEIFNMFNSYLESRQAHNLEIVIVLLITLEVILSIFNLHV
jgi:required for meiotic nuclear division protein 1